MTKVDWIDILLDNTGTIATGLLAIAAAYIGGWAAGHYGYKKDVKLHDDKKKEKQDIYLSAMRLIIDDLLAQYEKIDKDNRDTLSHNDQQNSPSQMRNFVEISIPGELEPKHWYEHSLLQTEKAKDLHYLYKSLEDINEYVQNPLHARPTNKHPIFKMSDYEEKLDGINKQLKKIKTELA